MDDEFLGDYMIVNIEKEITDNIDMEAMINEDNFMKDRKVKLK